MLKEFYDPIKGEIKISDEHHETDQILNYKNEMKEFEN